MTALAPLGKKLRPSLFSLADKDHVGKVGEIILPDRNPRAADDGKAAASPKFTEDLVHAHALHVHAGYPDDIGARTTLEIDRFDILVDQGDRMPARRQSRQSGRLATGSTALMPRNGIAYSSPQYEVSRTAG